MNTVDDDPIRKAIEEFRSASPIFLESPMSKAQSIRLRLVIELIRAGKIDDCLSLAHEAEQFVINGMENRDVDVPAESNSSWPQTKEEVVSEGAGWIMRDAAEAWKEKWEDSIRVARERLAGDDPEKNKVFDSLIQSEMFVQGGTVKFVPNAKCDPDPSIQEKFNEKWKAKEIPNGGWHIPNPELDASAESSNKEMFKKLVLGNVEAPSDPSQEEVHGGGESTAPPMSLWEMCEAIITAPDPDNIGPKNWALLKHNKASSFEILGVGDAVGTSFVIHAATIMPESEYDKVRDLLMQFPPFKK